MTSSDRQLYFFPRIRQVSLHSFSLYSLEPNISVSFPGGVLCLAGANGIGKSTFLATVNYALTGAVPHPKRRLLSIDAYWKSALDYSGEFFSGRIGEFDRDNAAVTLEFQIKDSHYKVTRGLFDPNDVRVFDINGKPAEATGRVTTPSIRAAIYKEKVTEAIGVNSFEQFVFLQHFVFTFDEARHLLFWDEAATARSLFLCFGVDPREAAKHDLLSREAEQAGSRGRNAQFQVNNTRKRIEVLEQSIAGNAPANGSNADLDSRYLELEETAKQAAERAEVADAKTEEAEIQLSQRSADVASLRAAYNNAFNQFLHRSTKATVHPLVSKALNEGICAICDTHGEQVKSSIKSRIDQNRCPLCGSEVEAAKDGDLSLKEELAKIDAKLAIARARQEEVSATCERLRTEAKTARTTALTTQDAVAKFENTHQTTIEQLKAKRALQTGPLSQTLDGLYKAMEEFSAVRDLEYAQRDKCREEVRRMQKALELRYAHAEEDFLPRFRKLSGLFLGMDLDILLQPTPPAGIKLVVELRGNARHDENQMSESQRFFVDIALRMALAQQMSADNSPATLFIDTPEGSLDIAYEDRAGKMFAQFVESGHDIFMTANINSSKLLTTLARNCGSNNMSLNPMTGWTELSEVQQSATGLFNEAYKEIVRALQDGPGA